MSGALKRRGIFPKVLSKGPPSKSKSLKMRRLGAILEETEKESEKGSKKGDKANCG